MWSSPIPHSTQGQLRSVVKDLVQASWNIPKAGNFAVTLGNPLQGLTTLVVEKYFPNI